MQSGNITGLLFYAAVILICAVRARKRGRSVLGWALFAFFLAPLAILITWFVGPKKRAKNIPPEVVPTKPSSATTPSTKPRSMSSQPPVLPPSPLPAPVSSVPQVPVPADTSIIDITGQEQPLRFPVAVAVPQSAASLTGPLPASYTAPDYGYEMPRLGKQYRNKLGLTKQQVDWLDKFWSPQNVFVAIEGCRVATVKLYLRALPLLEQTLAQQETSLAQEAARTQQESVRLRKASTVTAGYTWQGYDEHYQREQAEAILYSTLFRRCENLVREAYGHKRRLAADFAGLEGDLGAQLEIRLGAPLNALLPTLQDTIERPSEATEVALNLQNVTRWKQQLEELAASLSAATVPAFVAGVYQLGQRNARNPAVENIFFEASKLVAKFDKQESLRFYLHYLHHDLRSATINGKQLAKTIQKSLFPQPDQLTRFEAIVQQLLATKDLNQALAQLPTVYAQQRKKIQLDLGAIQQVQHQHAGTVELLNEYLQDEPEPTSPLAPETTHDLPEDLRLSENEEVSLTVAADTSPAPAAETGTFQAGLTFAQQQLLALFAGRGLTVPQADVEAFARQHGLLRNQLVDSLNEQCYDLLDDVLIEEDGDQYTIYDSYYQQLAIPC